MDDIKIHTVEDALQDDVGQSVLGIIAYLESQVTPAVGPNKALNALLGALVNYMVLYETDVDEAQRALREIADQLPQMIAQIQAGQGSTTKN